MDGLKGLFRGLWGSILWIGVLWVRGMGRICVSKAVGVCWLDGFIRGPCLKTSICGRGVFETMLGGDVL